jgi:small subunit ribosomal protein S3Ae
MAANAQPSAPSKKVVDSWKAKKWYVVIAPNFLNNMEAAEVPAESEETLVNRIIELPLKDITRDLSHMYTTVRLRVSEVVGRKAYAKYIGHSVAKEYMRTLARRKRDLVDIVMPVVSKDGVEFRIKVLVVSANPISGRQKHAVRMLVEEELKKKTASTEFGPFILDVLYNRTSEALHKALVKILPVRRVEVWKTQLKEEFDTEKVEEEEEGQEPTEEEGAASEKPSKEEVEEQAA